MRLNERVTGPSRDRCSAVRELLIREDREMARFTRLMREQLVSGDVATRKAYCAPSSMRSCIHHQHHRLE